MFISKKAVIAGVSTLVLVGGAGALAAYTTFGEGTEQITSASLDEVAIELEADLSDIVLYPGVDSEVEILARNIDRDVPLQIKEIAGVPDADIKLDVPAGQTCPDGTFGASTRTLEPKAVIMPRERDVVVGYLSVDMATGAPNGCQGVTLTIELDATAESVVVPTR